MTTDAVMQHVMFLIDHPAKHGHVLAQLAIDQTAVDVVEHFRRFELAQHPTAARFVQQAGGHELEQHGDECR